MPVVVSLTVNKELSKDEQAFQKRAQASACPVWFPEGAEGRQVQGEFSGGRMLGGRIFHSPLS